MTLFEVSAKLSETPEVPKVGVLVPSDEDASAARTLRHPLPGCRPTQATFRAGT